MKSFNTYVEDLSEGNMPHDYVKARLTKHFSKMGVPHKVKSGIGYHSIHIGKDIKVSAAGAGVSVTHKGKEVHHQGNGKLNWRKAADHAEDLHLAKNESLDLSMRNAGPMKDIFTKKGQDKIIAKGKGKIRPDTKVPAKGASKLTGFQKRQLNRHGPTKEETVYKLTKESVRYATDNEYALAEVGMEEDYPDYKIEGIGVEVESGNMHIMASGLTFMMDAESAEIEEVAVKIDLDEETINEILSIQGRRKLGISAKRRARVLRTARLKASKRIASKGALKKRAGRKSRDFYFRKLSQGKGRKGTSLARRKEIEKRVQRFKKGVDRRAKRLLPQVRKADIAKKRG